MTALKVIGIILLILLLIASVRVRALARFGEKTELTLFVGPFRMTLLPEKEKKPAPDGFLMAMEHFGVAPADTIIFEDSPEGIQAAQASGAPYLLVREIR